MDKSSKRRDALLKYAVIHHLSYNETQRILEKYQQELLYVRLRRDSIISYGLLHNKDIDTINKLCRKYNQELLM